MKEELPSLHPSSFRLHPFGEVQEWLNWQHWKCCVRGTVPWVRIPPSPPAHSDKPRSATRAADHDKHMNKRTLLSGALVCLLVASTGTAAQRGSKRRPVKGAVC